jgi:hypothetical protein
VGFCLHEDHYRVRLAGGDTVESRAVVIASGARYRRLDLPRMDELTGLGVYYAATPMEAQMCGGSHVAIAGGGNSAGQAAVFLSRSVRKVTLIIRRPDLAQTMSRYLIDQIERIDNVEVLAETEVVELVGERAVEALIVNERGERRRLDATALFVFIGADPHTGWLETEVKLDDKGFVLTGQELDGAPDEDARPRYSSRRARPASSRSATCALARSSASRRQSARDRWPCGSCTSTSRTGSRVRTPVCDLLGIEVPVVLAPFGPWKQVELAAAVSNAGALGSVGTAIRSADELRPQWQRLRELTGRPFAINHTGRPFGEAVFAASLEAAPAAISFHMGVPRERIAEAHDAGALWIQQVGDLRGAGCGTAGRVERRSR